MRLRCSGDVLRDLVPAYVNNPAGKISDTRSGAARLRPKLLHYGTKSRDIGVLRTPRGRSSWFRLRRNCTLRQSIASSDLDRQEVECVRIRKQFRPFVPRRHAARMAACRWAQLDGLDAPRVASRRPKGQRAWGVPSVELNLVSSASCSVRPRTRTSGI